MLIRKPVIFRVSAISVIAVSVLIISFTIFVYGNDMALAQSGEQASGDEIAGNRNSKVMVHFLKIAEDTVPALQWNARTVKEHRAWKKEFKAKMLELLGRMPEPVPLKVEWTEKTETGLFTRHKIYVQSEKYYWVPAYYFVPKNLKKKTPAIVCLHGHSGIVPYIREGDENQLKKSKEHSLDYAVYLAEHGYITIAPVIRGWNETVADKDHGREYSCRRVTMNTFLLGMTPMGLRCWDAMRLIDFLETQEMVDSARIGAAGLSGGGTLTMYLPILDDRVRLSMIAGAFSTYRASIYSIPHCICNCLPHVMEWGEHPDVVALQAPRPVLLINGIDDDIFPITEAREGYEKLKRVYTLLDVPDNVDADFFDGPHAWSNNKTLSFLKKHLGE